MFTIPAGFTSAVAKAAGSGAGKNALERALDMVGSKGGQTIIGAVGSGISAYGQGKQAEADRAASAASEKANLIQRERENEMSDSRLRQAGALEASPMGAEQGFAQKQALMRALLGNARNVSFTPGDPGVAAAMGSFQGGLRLPEGGLDSAMLERLYGDEATQASIAARQKNIAQLSPGASFVDMGTLFGKAEGGTENPFTTDVRMANAAAQQQQLDESSKHREAVMAALAEGNKKQGGGRGGGGRAMGALSGAAGGASMGSMFGPVGAAIGGIGGFLKGLF